MEPEFIEWYDKNKNNFIGVPLNEVYQTWKLSQKFIKEQSKTNKQLLNG